ncbi:ferritin-like domain-containing protein [Arthrobacter humicola]|uniref:ferritin-like domain-containing protein n=1 Tax=Arthrobacter humicola TaxID=409291 RepID=UPI001FADEA40|nr:ferritin-like domain-containing protein [Arthrobacter humicola]MCI9870795.1 ferritin-like domain-containing protein [Arthrobacter humicola]
MKDDTREKRWQDHFPRSLPRYVLLVCLALVVVSLGVVLTPASPPEPAIPPFSEQARAAALAETRQLLDAGSQLGTAARADSKDGPAEGADGRPADAGNPAIDRTVTLLTLQAQALLAPGESPADPAGAASASGRATPPAASAAPLPATAAGLVAALAGSGRQRLADAAKADGGMARLLAAVGTAQLLQASALAAGTGTAAPAADVTPPQVSGTCPSQSATAPTTERQAATEPSTAAQPEGEPTAAASSLGGALASAARTEAQTIYGYQVALTRLGGDAAKSAAEELAHHDALLGAVESLSRLHCSAVPAREAGYALAPSFLASPAAGLGDLEAAALPVYGDLVALSEGATRQWAIAALFGSAKRAVQWGADSGALPGLDRASMPTRPAGETPSQPAG